MSSSTTTLQRIGALLGNRPDPADGAFLGADGRMYPAGTPLSQIPGVTPSDGRKPVTKGLFVNGIRQDPSEVLAAMQEVADASGAEVVGIYNATHGTFRDLTQSVLDRLDLGDNAAVHSLEGFLESAVAGGEPVQLFAYSQGTLIASRALEDLEETLRGEGLTEGEAKARMGGIHVDLFAAATKDYPGGPRYSNYVNGGDWASLLGGGTSSDTGATVVRFKDGNWLSGHDLSRYLRLYTPIAA